MTLVRPKNTWRNDLLTSIEVAYMNHTEIISLITNDNSIHLAIF
jgi:hypothetical protein